MDGRASVSARVVDAVSAAEDRGPIELPPLHEVIETDALNALFDAEQDAGAKPLEVCFCYSESIVTVHGDGSIDVAPRGPETEASRFHTRRE